MLRVCLQVLLWLDLELVQVYDLSAMQYRLFTRCEFSPARPCLHAQWGQHEDRWVERMEKQA